MNPFVYGKVVEKKDFCSRDQLVSELEGCIESGQNTVLFGRRRVGKSSLVLNAAGQFPKRLFFRVDLFFTKDTSMFLEYCSNALMTFQPQRQGLLEKSVNALKRIRPRVEFSQDGSTPSLSFSVERQSNSVLLNTIDDFFGFLGEEFDKDQLVVCFDEFQSILAYPEADALLAKIRANVQYHPFSYIFTGSDRSGLKTIFTEPKSPFYKSIRPIAVGPIPREDFQPFLQKRFVAGGRTVAENVWDSIFQLAVPGDIQQLCAALWENSDSGGQVNRRTLEKAYDRIFSQEMEGFRSLLRELTSLQLRVLKVIAKQGAENLYSLDTQQTVGASASSIRRSLSALQKKWVVVRDGNELYFNNPFLKQFLIERNI